MALMLAPFPTEREHTGDLHAGFARLGIIVRFLGENACMEQVEAHDYPVLVFLREQLRRARAENDVLQQALREAKDQIGPLRSALDTAEAELARARADRTGDEGYVAEILAQSERNLTHERHRVELTEANLAAAQGEIDHLQRAIDELRQGKAQVETEVERERRRAAEALAQLNAALAAVSELKDALSDLQEAYDAERKRAQQMMQS
jgi:chromosome segregation ATPase